MHEPLFIDVSLPFIRYHPLYLQGTLVLVEMERELRQVLDSSEGDGGHILRELLQIPGRISGVSEDVAHGVLRMPRGGKVSNVSDHGRRHAEEDHLNHGYRGAHVAIPFQCEAHWIINLERRLPMASLDDMYVSIIRRVNLDAMAGRAKSLIAGHVVATLRSIKNCQMIRKTQSIEARGPMPLQDLVGMGIAVEMITYSLMARPRIRGQRYVQYATVRKVRST